MAIPWAAFVAKNYIPLLQDHGQVCISEVTIATAGSTLVEKQKGQEQKNPMAKKN